MTQPAALSIPWHVAIDLDDTITAAPDMFAAIMRALRAGQIRVTVLTANDQANAPGDILKSLGMEDTYDAVVVVAVTSDDVPAAKARYCQQADVDLLIDDDSDNTKACRAQSNVARFKKADDA